MKIVLAFILWISFFTGKSQVKDDGHQINYLTWSDTLPAKHFIAACAVPNLIKPPSSSQQRYFFVHTDEHGASGRTEESISYIDEIGAYKKAYIFGNGDSVYFEVHDMITPASENTNPGSFRKVRFFYFIGADKNLHILFARQFFPF